MELVEGVSVSQILRKAAKEQVSFPPELAAYIALETANGLHAAHSLTDEQGNSVRLVHRDVSPQNILVGYDGTVRVTDFGIAKLSTATHATTTGLVKGKLAYMSPEQTRAEPLDGRSDVFSLGIVLQELLTLKRLFAGDSPAQIVFDVLSRDPELASDVRPDVPRELADVALRCLVKAPSGRYASASDVASALREAMDVSGRAAGGAELAAWMTEFFESERRAFHEQLAVARPEAPIVSAVTATPLETEVTEKDEEPRGVPRRRPGAVIAVAFLSVAVVTGGALVAMRRSTPRSEAPAEATVPGVATPPSPPSTTSAAALPEPSAPEPSAASSAPAATASHSPGVVRPSARPVRSPPKPSPSTTASASKSLRFDTL